MKQKFWRDPIQIRNIAGNVNLQLWCEGHKVEHISDVLNPITWNDTWSCMPSSSSFFLRWYIFIFLTEGPKKFKIRWKILSFIIIEVIRMGNIKLRLDSKQRYCPSLTLRHIIQCRFREYGRRCIRVTINI